MQPDFLQTVVQDTGHLDYAFDEETTFYNNFISIDPDLIILQATAPDKISRIINILLYIKYRHPVLIFTDNKEVADLVADSQGINVTICSPPYHHESVKTTIGEAIQHFSGISRNGHPMPVIVGNAPEILRIKKIAAGLGLNNDAVLIQGEAGVGKKLLAKRIHFASEKNDPSFVEIDIAGHVFEDNKQIISASDRAILKDTGGTLYLKAIESLPLPFQGTFLQFFNEDRIKNTRIIASSELKLARMVQQGRFRKDLYYRLNVIKMDIPPLRERITDIPLLADFFTTKSCIESGDSHFSLSDNVKKSLSVYSWPGNVKELEHFLTGKESLENEDLALNEIDEMIRANKEKPNKRLHLKKITRQVIGGIESEILKLVLEKTNWNRRRAAENLAISYKSLLNKIKAYNLT